MKLSKGKFVFLLSCAAPAFLFSCGKDKPAGAVKAPVAAGTVCGGTAGEFPGDPPVLPGSVTIIPSAPTSQTDLQAVFSGTAADLKFSWEVGGEEVDGVSGDRLDRTKFKKGDEVTGSVGAGAKSSSVTVTVGNAPPSVERVTVYPQYIYGGTD